MAVALALCGCGVMGRRHIAGMGKLKAAGRLSFDLVAVCDPVKESAGAGAALAEAHTGQRPAAFATLDEMARAVKHVDGVILTLAPDLHLSVGQEALARGMHVLSEKPITLTVAQGRAFVEAARKANRKLSVAENYRRDPMNRLARALIDAKAMGEPFLMVQQSSGGGGRVLVTPWRHLRSRGGVMVDMAIHYADIVEYLMGPVSSVAGQAALVDKERADRDGVMHPADSEDVCAAVMRLKSGALCHFLQNQAGRGEGMFVRRVYGTKGSLDICRDRSGRGLHLHLQEEGPGREVDGAAQLAMVPDFSLDDTTAALFGGERLSAYEMSFEDIDANLLAVEHAEFVEAIVNDRRPEVAGEDGLRSLALVFGMLESDREGRFLSVDDVVVGKHRGYQDEL